jgi:acyl-CoA synthetase (AMP-forming)/AMP-acid ligase II
MDILQAIQKRIILGFLSRFKIPRDITRFAFKKHAHKTVIISPEGSITYKNLDNSVLNLCKMLQQKQIKKGDFAFVMVEGINLIRLNLVAYEYGIIISTFNPSGDPDDLITAALQIQPKILLYDRKIDTNLLNRLKSEIHGIQFLDIISGDCNDFANDELPYSAVSILPTEIATIGFTSGTTGTPKMIAFEHGLFLRSMKLIIKNIKVQLKKKNSDMLLIGFPLSNRGGYVGLLPAFLTGSTIVIPDKYEAAHFLELIEHYKITDMHVFPSLLIDILDHPERSRFNISSLRKISYGAEIMPVSKLEEAIQFFGPIMQQGYGSSEAFPPVSMLQPYQLMENDKINTSLLSSVGKISKEVYVKITDNNFKPVSKNSIGEILIKSQTVFKGYWKNAAATEEAFTEGWYKTGDMGRVDENGYLFIIGRKSDVIVRDDNTPIYPRLVEEIIHTCPFIKECVLVMVNGKLTLAVSLRLKYKNSYETIKDEFGRFLNDKLDKQHLPDSIQLYEELPRSTRTKILRKEISKG